MAEGMLVIVETLYAWAMLDVFALILVAYESACFIVFHKRDHRELRFFAF